MSTEISVLSEAGLLSIEEWQRAIDAEGFPLKLSKDPPLDNSGGSLTVQLHDEVISIEYRIEAFTPLKEFRKDVDFGHDWKWVIAFPWITGFSGLTAAWMAAVAYARAVSGAVFDPQEAKVFNQAQARDVIQRIERNRPKAEAALRHISQRRFKD